MLVAATPSPAAGAVTLSIPSDLVIDPGGQVDVPLVLTNDVPVRALSLKVSDVLLGVPEPPPDELALDGAGACTVRTPGFACPANEPASATINVIVLNTSAVDIAAGDGAVMRFRLQDDGTPCVLGSVVELRVSNVTVSDPDRQPIAAVTVDGKVRCGDAGPTVVPTATVSSTPGTTASASVTTTATATPAPTATLTPTGTGTPTATVTPPAATATPTTGATASATGTLAPTPGATPTATPTAVATPLVTVARAKAIEKCQKTILKAGARFVGRVQKVLDGCAGRILKCVQRREPGAKRDVCIIKAGARCTAALAKLDARDEPKLRVAVAGKCGGPVLQLEDVVAMGGVGYARLAAECEAELGAPLATVADAASCLATQHDCHARQLVEARVPRTGELLRVAGVPSEARACLADYGGDGAGIGDPRTAGKAVDQCAAALRKAGSRFLGATLKGLQKCVALIVTCVQRKPGDDVCLAKAARKCDATFAKLAGADDALGTAIGRRCGPAALPFVNAATPTGLNVDALADLCAVYGVAPLDSLAQYGICVARQHQCLAEELLRFEAPRAAELLQQVNHDLDSPFCP
jgi:hypothetical protein